MARPTLTRHRKFRRLARLLGGPVIARGTLELLWDQAYESGDPHIGDATDVEESAYWTGTPGDCVAALVSCGFLDATETGYYVHDLWDHAPQYVKRRAEREAQRKQRGNGMASHRLAIGSSMASTPAPAPAHAHAPSVASQLPTSHTAPLTAGLKAHRTHAVCGRVCLHAKQFDELSRLSGKPDGDAYVRQWALGVLAAWPEGDAIGDDAWAFWRLRWGEAHPSTRKAARQVQDDAEAQRWLTGGHP